MPEQIRTAITELAATRADRAIPMPWKLWCANLIQTADEQLAWASFGRLVPDPYRPVFEPVGIGRVGTAEPDAVRDRPLEQEVLPGDNDDLAEEHRVGQLP
jgi:hypothetical protein